MFFESAFFVLMLEFLGNGIILIDVGICPSRTPQYFQFKKTYRNQEEKRE